MESPEGLPPAVEVSRFQPEEDVHYTVIANGGTASQMAPVILRLCRAGISQMKVYDLQRDGIKELS